MIPLSDRDLMIFLSTPCLDADECNAYAPVCDISAKCINTIGSFICACKTGFSGDGFSCFGKSIVFPYFLEERTIIVNLSYRFFFGL